MGMKLEENPWEGVNRDLRGKKELVSAGRGAEEEVATRRTPQQQELVSVVISTSEHISERSSACQSSRKRSETTEAPSTPLLESLTIRSISKRSASSSVGSRMEFLTRASAWIAREMLIFLYHRSRREKLARE